MINYDDSYRRIFRTASDNIDVLNRITGMRICADGYAYSNPVSHGIPHVELNSVTISSNNPPSFNITIDIPVFNISTTVDVNPGVSDIDGGIRIAIDCDMIGITDNTYVTEAELLLKNIIITPHRQLSLLGKNGINIDDGHNTSVSFSNGAVILTGGAGLGDGVYDIASLYPHKGIMAINGHNNTRDVNLSVSDKLIEYGAGIVW